MWMFADGNSQTLRVRGWTQQLICQSGSGLSLFTVLNHEDRMEVPNTVSVMVCRAAPSFCMWPVQEDDGWGGVGWEGVGGGGSVWTHKCPDFELCAGDGNLYFFKRSFFYIDMNVYLFCKRCKWRCVAQMTEQNSFLPFVISTSLIIYEWRRRDTSWMGRHWSVCWCRCFGPP